MNGIVVNTVRQRGGAAGGDTRGAGEGKGQQLVEDAAEGEHGALAEFLLARVSLFLSKSISQA